ncbi:MAG: NAD-dependent epimerase/dehydratase family protein [Chloroflexota bacterium]
MERVLVTGGAGFIGSHIVEALLTRGDSVRVLDNYSTGRRENLSGYEERIQVIEGDLRDPLAISHAVRDIDLIFHQAAFISVPQSMLEPETCFAVNVQGTVMLLEAARKSGVRKVVLASSTAVYGNCENVPVSEDEPLAPVSPYAVSKQVDELLASLYSSSYSLPVVALRYFNVFGPRQRPDSDYAAAIPIFFNQMLSNQPVTIYGDGRQSRDFIYVKDVVRANLQAAEADIGGEVFNVCTGIESSLLDLLETISGLSPIALEVRFEPPRHGDIYRSAGNPERAASRLGFRAASTLADGLQETLQWMRNEPS